MEEALTALLASVASGKRYWVRAPQSTTPPYVVMQRIDGLVNYQLSGPSGYVSSRVQLDVYAASYGSALSVSRAVKEALSGYAGGSIQGIMIDSERNLPAADAGDVNQLFRNSIDIVVHHGENQ